MRLIIFVIEVNSSVICTRGKLGLEAMKHCRHNSDTNTL